MAGNLPGVLRHRTQHLTVLGSPNPHIPISGCLPGPRVVPETSKCLLFLSNTPHSPSFKAIPGRYAARFCLFQDPISAEAIGGTGQASREFLSLPPCFPPSLPPSLSSIRNESIFQQCLFQFIIIRAQLFLKTHIMMIFPPPMCIPPPCYRDAGRESLTPDNSKEPGTLCPYSTSPCGSNGPLPSTSPSEFPSVPLRC